MKKIGILLLIMHVITTNAETLLLFGGKNNKVFLGCLNCNKYSSSSIWNVYGNYGSRYSALSIWNKYGEYGSRYNNYSTFNKYTLTAPVVVNENGNFYGYLTCNQYNSPCSLDSCISVLQFCNR